MRAFKISVFLVVILLLGSLITKYSVAQSEGALLKRSPDSTRTSAIEILPYGILVGEFDGRPWLNPYNGLFLSRNLGETWTELGLSERGITDLAHDNTAIYASTYYSVDGQTGLFKSLDKGQTFQRVGPNFSTSNVEVFDETIFTGGYNHGLWISKDQGQSWQQKIGNGTGWTGPQIVNITAGDGLALASTPTNIYKSLDNGNTWIEIPQLAGEQIHTFLISEDLVLAGTQNSRGVFKSLDRGETWLRLTSWGDYPTGKMIEFKNTIYVQKIDTITHTYNFYKTTNRGETWQVTDLDPGIRMKDIKLLYAEPAYFFISTEVDGIYRYSIPTNSPAQENFLQIPWHQNSPRELTDKITAYFDHQFPLTGYSFHQEPPEFQNDIISFFGFNESASDYFYSSHNGIDFALPYGTEVLAAAPGWAHYYYCQWCGHSIKIDHANGYQTVYMHLQQNGLISNSSSDKVWVESGTPVGMVGMTGKTTGPHLHFGVLKDSDFNSVFDDYPDGLVDPFAWLDSYRQDPWPNYSWQDILGGHVGTESSYLWSYVTPIIKRYIQETESTLTLGNKTISFNVNDLGDNLFTAMIINYLKPYIPFSQYYLDYVEGTSFSLTAENHYEEGITGTDTRVSISIDLTDLNLEHIIKDTLKVFVWDKIRQSWDPLPTIYDHLQNKLTAEATHMSHFAVMGEKKYPEPPLSSLLLDVEFDGKWYLQHPTVTISVQDNSNLGIKNTFYSLNDGLDWEIYNEPFLLNTEGVTTLLFRSEDMAGNLELTNSQIVRIDTQNRWKDNLRVSRNTFTVAF